MDLKKQNEDLKIREPELAEKRKLAYEIKHQRKGVYITRRFELPEFDEGEESKSEKEFGIEAITRKLNLFSDVLRFLIVKTEDLPDLGAKERRKAQEINQQQSIQRPKRPDAQRPQAFVQKKQRPEALSKTETKESAGNVSHSDTGGEAKDIDKQLDKLLDI
jgi:ribosomal protein S6